MSDYNHRVRERRWIQQGFTPREEEVRVIRRTSNPDTYARPITLDTLQEIEISKAMRPDYWLRIAREELQNARRAYDHLHVRMWLTIEEHYERICARRGIIENGDDANQRLSTLRGGF